MKNIFFILLMFAFGNVNAMDVIDTTHKEETKIEISDYSQTTLQATLLQHNTIMKTGSIGIAVKALKEGKLAKRHSWDSAKKFIFMQVPSTINSSIIPKMQSLPPDAKKEFIKTFDDSDEQIDAIYYSDQIAIVGLSNSVKGYSPSCEDILAEDWLVLN